MKIEINPQDTSRAEAFRLWMSSPMPMVTLTKTFDVTNLLKTSKKRSVKFNALLCWCIGKAASRIDEFYLLPEQNKLFRYDRIAVNVIVNNQMGVLIHATFHLLMILSNLLRIIIILPGKHWLNAKVRF